MYFGCLEHRCAGFRAHVPPPISGDSSGNGFLSNKTVRFIATNRIHFLVIFKTEHHLDKSRIRTGGFRLVPETTERVGMFQGGDEVIPKAEGKDEGTAR